MRKNLLFVLVTVLLAMSNTIYAQQLPNAGFEDWNGTKFDGKIQLTTWNAANVEQTYLGITARGNMIYRETDAHSGTYCAHVKNTKVEVSGIGEVSPSWITLGTPFTDITNGISGATAGTYGGVNWTYRPDTLQVWLKHTLGSGNHSEIFSIVYYAWTGTSKGNSYKAKNGSCVTIKEKIDEESDIRQLTDANACGTNVNAIQVAEGWHKEMTVYPEWTLFKVPINYYTNDVPEKMNIILAGGRYPDFRANTGIYEGNGIYIDDISLIYSSKAHEMYIGGRKYAAFNQNTYNYSYVLGNGVTTIPEITLKRSGRMLSPSEYTMTPGVVDGAPTTITIRAEDNSSTTTYTINFVSQQSDNARLSDIRVNGASITGFNAYLTNYDVSLNYGTTAIPTIVATPQDANATVSITNPTSVNGTATILVTAQDGVHTQTYTLNFSVAQLKDNTLKDILVDGVSLPGFKPSTSNYMVSLPLGTTQAPTITPVSAYPAGAQTITILKNSLTDGCQIQVSAPGATGSKTYKLTYKIEASSYAYLSDIKLNGVSLSGFEPTLTSYSCPLALGTTTLPTITWTQGDPYQTVALTEGGVDGVTKIVVTAAAGNTITYRLNFSTEKSSVDTLAMITLDGVDLADFDSHNNNYNITLPAGTATLPVVGWTAGDSYQTITSNVNTSLQTVRLTVKAGDGTQRVYTLTFSVEKSANALLQMIYLDGVELSGFAAETLDYSVALATEVIPAITVLGNEGQRIAISSPAGFGTARIVVTPEEGSENVYTIVFRSASEPVLPAFPTDSIRYSSEALLQNIYVEGAALAGFAPTTYSYTVALPQGTTMVPAVYPVPATNGQDITVYQSVPDGTTRIHVVAADKVTTQDYTIAFPLTKLSNAELLSVELDGVDFTFVPATLTYDILLPYGTTATPTISFEKADASQRVVLTQAPLSRPSTLVVTAEDGTSKTYTFNFSVAQSTADNVLTSIAVDGVGLLDMTTGPDFTISLPYDATSLDVVSFTKSFPEQMVVIENGGVKKPTIITVSSGRAGDPDMVYTLTPSLPAYDPAALLSISVDGTPIDNFDPAVYNYVFNVSAAPTAVTYGAQTGADVTEKLFNHKSAVLNVENGSYKHTYTITFFYPGDVTFDGSFEHWTAGHNDGANKDGFYPNGWNTPLTAATSGDKGSYDPQKCVTQIAEATEGASCAKLSSIYLLTSAEAMPGFISLSQPTVKVGTYYLLSHSASTLSYGAPITFRNTPDQVMVDYNYQASNRVTGWRFMYKANGSNKVSYAGTYASLKKNEWNTFTQDLTYDDGFLPNSLDIIVSASHTDDLSKYYVGAGGASSGNHWTATLWVDNLRLLYNSKLASLKVNGAAATISGTNITATIDAEYVGTPSLTFAGEVADQGQTVVWSDEVAGVRTAAIRNFAEDGSYTDYTLTVTRPLSAVTTCTYSVDGKDLTYTPGSYYQTVAVSTNDTAYVLNVTAENGATATYYAKFAGDAASAADVVTISEPVETLTGASTGRMSQVFIDETPVMGFAADITSYILAQDGILTYTLDYAHDSVVFNINDSIYTLNVVGSTANTEYTIRRTPSDNALLSDLKINGETITGFYAETFNYNLSLSALTSVEATVQDATADAQTVIVKQDETHYAIFVYVTAQDGSTAVYGIEATVRALRSTAYLQTIKADGVALADFAQTTFSYTINLPAGSAMPMLSAVALDGATVEATTTNSGSSSTVTFHVTAEDGGATNDYVVNVNILPSSVNTLAMIYLDGVEMEGFDAATETYNIVLPYGTTALPTIDYVKSDRNETVVVTPTPLTLATLLVTAEDGSTKTYTINFTVAKSDNANLASLTMAGLEGFDKEDTSYDVVLPFGTTELPTITYAAEDAAATALLVADGLNKATITVTAEDGVTTKTYTINFTVAKSNNAALLMIFADGNEVENFDPADFEYTMTLPYGTTELPTFTWTTADEQQVVTTETNAEKTLLTIIVTAGDGVTSEEYTIAFSYLLSDNNFLADLQVKGATIEGFRRDSMEYAIVYPVGTAESGLLNKDGVLATPEDADAVVTISEDADHTITIMVTAPNGDIRVYVISQSVLLSDEARLKMIYLDEVALADFDSDVLEYTIIVRQGTTMPVVTAEALDPRAGVEYGDLTDEEGGSFIEIDGVAEDGTILTYTVHFQLANWVVTAEVDDDDFLFVPVKGTDTYLAVTISSDVRCGVYDLDGHLLKLEEVPVADPAFVKVETDEDGNQKLVEVYDGCNGMIFEVPNFGQPYCYVFYNVKTKRVGKGGKFMLIR